MLNFGMEDGLYLVRRTATKGGGVFTHYALLDIGNRLYVAHRFGNQPVLIHQVQPRLSVEPFVGTGPWDSFERILDEAGARERFRVAAQNPEYNLIGNNCEQFARFVAYGERHSEQVFAGVVLAVVAGGAAYAFHRSKQA